MTKLRRLPELFLSLFKIGLFTFGGGYAMIALLEREFVTRKRWIDMDEFFDLTTIAESTPGPIAINAATYIGYKRAGFLGALVGTLAMCLPSFLIIYFITLFFDSFLSVPIVAKAFKGIQVCVIYLILTAGMRISKKLKKTPLNIVIMTLTILCMETFSILSVSFSSIYYILAAGCLGIIVWLCERRRQNP